MMSGNTGVFGVLSVIFIAFFRTEKNSLFGHYLKA